MTLYLPYVDIIFVIVFNFLEWITIDKFKVAPQSFVRHIGLEVNAVTPVSFNQIEELQIAGQPNDLLRLFYIGKISHNYFSTVRCQPCIEQQGVADHYFVPKFPLLCD